MDREHIRDYIDHKIVEWSLLSNNPEMTIRLKCYQEIRFAAYGKELSDDRIVVIVASNEKAQAKIQEEHDKLDAERTQAIADIARRRDIEDTARTMIEVSPDEEEG